MHGGGRGRRDPRCAGPVWGPGRGRHGRRTKGRSAGGFGMPGLGADGYQRRTGLAVAAEAFFVSAYPQRLRGNHRGNVRVFRDPENGVRDREVGCATRLRPCGGHRDRTGNGRLYVAGTRTRSLRARFGRRFRIRWQARFRGGSRSETGVIGGLAISGERMRSARADLPARMGGGGFYASTPPLLRTRLPRDGDGTRRTRQPRRSRFPSQCAGSRAVEARPAVGGRAAICRWGETRSLLNAGTGKGR